MNLKMLKLKIRKWLKLEKGRIKNKNGFQEKDFLANDYSLRFIFRVFFVDWWFDIFSFLVFSMFSWKLLFIQFMKEECLKISVSKIISTTGIASIYTSPYWVKKLDSSACLNTQNLRSTLYTYIELCKLSVSSHNINDKDKSNMLFLTELASHIFSGLSSS